MKYDSSSILRRMLELDQIINVMLINDQIIFKSFCDAGIRIYFYYTVGLKCAD